MKLALFTTLGRFTALLGTSGFFCGVFGFESLLDAANTMGGWTELSVDGLLLC